MEDDALMVELLAAAAQRCEGLGRLFADMSDVAERVSRDADALDATAETAVDTLGATLKRLTQAANLAAETIETTAEATTDALSRAVKQAGVASEAIDDLVKRTDESARGLESVTDTVLESVVRLHVTALDKELGSLGTEMKSLQAAMDGQRSRCAQAIGQAGQDLEQACAEHDTAQRSWAAATNQLLHSMSDQAGGLSHALAFLADGHADAMIVTFNQSADDQNDVMAAAHHAFTDDLEPELYESQNALDEARSELAMHATERSRQFAEADEGTAAEVSALEPRIAAVVADLQTTQEIKG